MHTLTLPQFEFTKHSNPSFPNISDIAMMYWYFCDGEEIYTLSSTVPFVLASLLTRVVDGYINIIESLT